MLEGMEDTPGTFKAIISLRIKPINSLEDLRGLPHVKPYIKILTELLTKYIEDINNFNRAVEYWRYYLEQDDGNETVSYLEQYTNVIRNGYKLVVHMKDDDKELLTKYTRVKLEDVSDGEYYDYLPTQAWRSCLDSPDNMVV